MRPPGSTKAATCTACHGLNGNSVNPEWPVLAGQNAAYLRDQITRFRRGKRTNPLMQPMVQNLTDQDIGDLAAFYATADAHRQRGRPFLTGRPARSCIAAAMRRAAFRPAWPATVPWGAAIPAAAFPALQTQHAVYTIKQLNDYAARHALHARMPRAYRRPAPMPR